MTEDKYSRMLKVGIDASRNRSGGAKAYLIGILSECDPAKYGISEIHVWSYRSLLDKLPNRTWLIKHNPVELEQSLHKQLLWQAFSLHDAIKTTGCNILYTTDSSTLCLFKPNVVLNQDLLSFEPGMMRYYGFGIARLRLLAIRMIQTWAFRRSAGVIFLTEYASKIIQELCGPVVRSVCIPHGVDASFKQCVTANAWPSDGGRSIRCIYVSNAELYKYQWVVVDAVSLLRRKGYDISLKLVGGGSGAAQILVQNSIARVDPERQFVEQLDFLPHEQLPNNLMEADLFVFASGCETFGITLLEGMSVGLPIACSDRSSLPETLQDGGVYFNPTDVDSIAEAIEKIIHSDELRLRISQRAKSLAQKYSWSRCADETWTFVANTNIGK